MLRHTTAFGLILAAATLSSPTPASACGGCFNPPTSVQVVTDHRMVLSLTRDRTVLWDQIRYTGRPSDFSWILPIRNGPDVRVEIADNLFVSSLDSLTAPLLTRPLPPNSFCATSGGGGLFGASSSSSPTADRSSNEAAQVNVYSERTVGAYQQVVIGSTDAMALRNWLTANGYSVPEAVVPIIEYYVAMRMDFVALRLNPSADVTQMQPVRVITPGYNPSLPLRMIAAGVADKVGLLLMVLSESRIEAMNYPNAEVRDADLRYDFDAPSDPARDFINAFNRVNVANNNRAWVTESAAPTNQYTIENRIQSCFDPTTFQRTELCTPNPAVDPTDTSVAFQGSTNRSMYVTRLRADLARGSLDQDLQLAASDRGQRIRSYRYGAIVNTPPDPCASPHSDFEGCSTRGGDTSTLGAVCAALAAVMLRAARRKR